jgi:hypothetical protein
MPDRRRRNRSGGSEQRTLWYYRDGYHLGVWSGAAFGVAWYAAFQELLGLIVGVVAGQVVGILLARRGRKR